MTANLPVEFLPDPEEQLADMRERAATAQAKAGLDRMPVLPDTFWDARPVLAEIRQAARSLPVAPDALMGAVLALLSVRTDYRFQLPFVGARGSLNLLVALVGPSGAGKGTAMSGARDVLGPWAPQRGYDIVEDRQIGSAQGLVKAFYEDIPGVGSYQRYQGALFSVPEGEQLKTMSKTSGHLMAHLRQAFSGEALGAAYATGSKNLFLPGHGYRLSMVVGLQPFPAICDFIFADHAGTPQRILWFATSDPTLPNELVKEPSLPLWAPIPWTAPLDILKAISPDPRIEQALAVADSEERLGNTAAAGTARQKAAHLSGKSGSFPPPWARHPKNDPALSGDPDAGTWAVGTRTVVVADPEIVQDLRTAKLERVRDMDLYLDDPGAHAELLRLKVAALLAFLDRRVWITTGEHGDWELAGTVVDNSSAVARWVQRQCDAIRARRSAPGVSRRDVEAENRRRFDETVIRQAEILVRFVGRHGSTPPGQLINRALSGARKSNGLSNYQEFGESALVHALKVGWLVQDHTGRCCLPDEGPRDEGRVPKCQSFVNMHPAALAPTVLRRGTQTKGDEWYTPVEVVEAVRALFGGKIDLDPASCPVANEIVKADVFYTKEDDGLAQEWSGRVFMNPPYSRPLVDRFIERLVEEYRNGSVKEAVVLVNNATETTAFQTLAAAASTVCLIQRRLKFWNPDKAGESGPLSGQVVLYLGDSQHEFLAAFARFGRCLLTVELHPPSYRPTSSCPPASRS